MTSPLEIAKFGFPSNSVDAIEQIGDVNTEQVSRVPEVTANEPAPKMRGANFEDTISRPPSSRSGNHQRDGRQTGQLK
jgi:hypothetical protein